MSEKWVETRKEFEVNEAGELKPIKVIHERDRSVEFSRKEIVDLSLRFIAALSIAIPIIIFIAQRGAEVKRQKEQFKFDVYTNISAASHAMYNSNLDSAEYIQHKKKLLYEFYPKLLLLGDTSIIGNVNHLIDNFILNEFYKSSMNSNEKVFREIIRKYRNFDKIKDSISKLRLDNLKTPFTSREETDVIISFDDEYMLKSTYDFDSLRHFKYTMVNLSHMLHHINVEIDSRIVNKDGLPDEIRWNQAKMFNTLADNALASWDNYFQVNTSKSLRRLDSLITKKSTYLQN